MENRTNPELAEQFAAALAWWREAGVDLDFADEPKCWLAPVQPAAGDGGAEAEIARRTRAEPAPPPAQTPVTIPDDLEGFRNWWLTEPELDSEHMSGRIAPRGVAGAELMIVAPSPEDIDREHLLSGPHGGLLERFLSVAGVDASKVYWASVLPCHSPGADWSPEATRTLARALVRHVALVRPQRLMVCGMNILPLLGHASPQGSAVSLEFNHEGVTVPVLAVRRIPAAASQPRWKAALWRAWLDWTG